MQEGKYLYEFGAFRLDPAERLLLRDGSPVTLFPKAFDTLAVLVENGGHLISKDELIKRVWPDTFVEEVNLARNISAIRRALGEAESGEQYIETVPKCGYRFISQIQRIAHSAKSVEDVPPPIAPPEASEKRSHTTARFTRLMIVGAIAFLLVLAALIVLPRITTFRLASLWSTSSANTIRSIAVLPLVNLSSDPEQEYFSDGMTDQLITELAKFRKLRVISHTSVERYKQARQPLPQIARELSVDAIVEGRVMRSGDRVRVTAQLIDARSDQHLWAESYERDLRDILSLQSEVAKQIAMQVGTSLSSGQILRRYDTPLNAAAYEDYLKGRNRIRRLLKNDIITGMQLLERSIQQDANYAPAYAEQAFAYQMLGSLSHYPPREVFPKGKAAALKALNIDENSAEAHALLGVIYGRYEWDWAGEGKEINRALQLDPNSSFVRLVNAFHLLVMGRNAESERELRTALELDPFSPFHHVSASVLLRWMRNYDVALQEARQAVQIDPSFAHGHLVLASALGAKGVYPEAFAEWLRYLSLDGDLELSEELQSAAKKITGPGHPERKLARITLDYCRKKSKTKYVSPLMVAATYVDIGDNDSAFESLNRAYSEHEASLYAIAFDPTFDSLRSDPRFQDLLRRMNLPTSSDAKARSN